MLKHVDLKISPRRNSLNSNHGGWKIYYPGILKKNPEKLNVRGVNLQCPGVNFCVQGVNLVLVQG